MGGGLPLEEVAAKKFGMSFETQGNQCFGQDILGFLLGYPGVPEKFEKKFVFESRLLGAEQYLNWGEAF